MTVEDGVAGGIADPDPGHTDCAVVIREVWALLDGEVECKTALAIHVCDDEILVEDFNICWALNVASGDDCSCFAANVNTNDDWFV